MARVSQDRLIGAGLVVSSTILFATLPIMATSLSRSGVSAWLQVASRLGISTLVFALVILITTRRMVRLPRRDELWFPIANGFLAFSGFSTYILALALGTPPPKAVLIAYIYPLIGAILSAIFLKEKLTGRKIIAVLIGIAGVMVAFEVWSVKEMSQFQPSDILCFANAFITATILVFGRLARTRLQLAPIYITTWSFGAGLIWLLLFAGVTILLGGSGYVADQLKFTMEPMPLIVGLLGISLIGTALPYFMIYAGLGRIPSSIAGVFSLPEVIAVFVFSAIALGQSIREAQLAGAAIILAAGIMVNE